VIRRLLPFRVRWWLEAELRPRWCGQIRYHGPALSGSGAVGWHTYSLTSDTWSPEEALRRAHRWLLEHLMDVAPCASVDIDSAAAIPISYAAELASRWYRFRRWSRRQHRKARAFAHLARALVPVARNRRHRGGRNRQDAPARGAASVSVEAQFTGRCGICDLAIRPGDEIEQVEGEWCHADCAEGES